MIKRNIVFGLVLFNLLITIPIYVLSKEVNRTTDSLINILRTVKSDSSRANLLIRISKSLRKTDLDSSVYYLNRALEIGKTNGLDSIIAESYYQLGEQNFFLGNYKESKKNFQLSSIYNERLGLKRNIAYGYYYLGTLFNNYYESNRDSCLSYFIKAIKIFESIGEKQGEGLVYNGFAINYYYNEEYNEALSYYSKALTRFQIIKSNEGIANALNNIALIYLNQGKFVPALDSLHRALTFYEKSDNWNETGNNLNIIGALFIDLYDYANAEKYLERSLSYIKKRNNPLYLSMVYDNFGLLYENQQKYSEALTYYKLGHTCDLKAKNDYYLSYSYCNIAKTFFNLGQYDSAIYNLNKSLEIARLTSYSIIELENYITLARLKKSTGHINEAIQYSNLALKHLKMSQEKDKEEDISGLLSELYSIKGDYKKAYEYHLTYKKISDSVFSAKEIRVLAAKEYEYNYTKKLKEQELLHEQERQISKNELRWQKIVRNFWLAVAFLLILLTAITYGSYSNKRSDNKSLKEKNLIINEQNTILTKQKEELAEANASKDKFFSIIAHDIRNPLSAIIGLSESIEDSFEILNPRTQLQYIRLINQSSNDINKLLENLLQWSRIQTGRLVSNPTQFYLIDVIKPILSLHEVTALRKSIVITNNCDKDITVYADYSMIATVIRNLISNAIKFTPEGGKIYIDSELLGELVKIKVRDTGIGITAEDQKKIFRKDINFSKRGTSGEKGTGLGLLLCKEFIEKNNGHIDVESNDTNGSTFWFTLFNKQQLQTL